MKPFRSLIAGSVLLSTAVIFIVFQQDDTVSEQPPPSSNVSTKQESTAPDQWDAEFDSATVLPYTTQVAPLPKALEGAQINYQLAVDEQGNLRISTDVRAVFDFFLSAVHEEGVDTIVQRITEYLEFQLEEPALSQAKAMMADYLAMKGALYDYEKEQGQRLQSLVESGNLRANSLMLLEEQLEARNRLRAEHLGQDVHEAFFADEEVYDAYTLSRMKVLSSEQLSDAEKAERLAQIDAQAPADLVASRRETQMVDELQLREAALQEQGAGKEAITELRTEMFGAEAAERFAELDNQRQAWQTRVDSYLQQRQSLLNNQGLAQADLDQEIERLRQASFDSREQIRVQVYERQADAQVN